MLSLESHNHADSYLVPIVEDMAEIGIQVWQGVLPENDIPALQQKLHGRLVLMGGMGAAIDRTDAAPEEQLRRIESRNGPEKAQMFRDRWIPFEEMYFQAFDVQARCDIVIEG